MLDYKKILDYLSIIDTLKKRYQFYDIHLHPLEIINDNLTYTISTEYNDLYSLNNVKYIKPKLHKIYLNNHTANNDKIECSKSNFSNLIGLRKIYSHIGPKVIEDHLRLSCIDKVLLLPVANENRSIENQMENIVKYYGIDQKYQIGYSVPNSISDNYVLQNIKDNQKRYNIKALKIHPNITKINMNQKSGKNRIEIILDSCHSLQLPIIIHGGKNNILQTKGSSQFAVINNFIDIDWDISSSAVIIAHAGGYDCSISEIRQTILPILKNLLKKHDKLLIDLSGNHIEVIIDILKKFDISKIVFGSDALYHTQWVELIKIMYALDVCKINIEESISRIASINPSTYIFEKED